MIQGFDKAVLKINIYLFFKGADLQYIVDS